MEGNLERSNIEPMLVRHFSDIRNDPKINLDEVEFTNTFGSEEYRHHLFEEAKKAFEFVFDRDKFIQNIRLERNNDSFSYLKQIRRYGLILKAAYNFSSVNHRCDARFNDFLFLLGKYNDSYWISQQSEIEDDIIQSIDGFDFSVDFNNTPEFKEHTKQILSEIDELVEKDALPVERFHKLRILVRSISNFMQVAAAENYGSGVHELFYRLFKMSTLLGDMHDNYVQMGLKGEIEYHEAVVDIGSDVVIELNALKPFIERVCGLA